MVRKIIKNTVLLIDTVALETSPWLLWMIGPVRYGVKTGRNFSYEFSSETKYSTLGNHEPLYLSI